MELNFPFTLRNKQIWITLFSQKETYISSLDKLMKYIELPPVSPKIGLYKVKFNEDGSITMGCTTVDKATVQKIWERLQ